MKNRKRSNQDIFNYFLIIIFIVSIISFINIYLQGYIPEVHMAKALPLSIIIGLTGIAITININKNKE
ncbi:hypothetical protein [Clostridium peptidivorans]|uniref:hypothetical protein n=1 Tax=Clostridium peptidivorans TaxID=100174 RepID=UPI000BE2EEE6|nr:hypothetical protein [Clostridium peptidivorans]